MTETTNDATVLPQTGVHVMRMEVTGDGPPIVLVGGGVTGWASWRPHAERLAATRTVARAQPLTVQLGLEGRPLPEGYDIPMESTALGRALDDHGWKEPIDIVGWSYGGLIALDFALDHPERVRTLTLIEPPAFWVLDDRGIGDSDVETIRSLDLREPIGEAAVEQFVRAVGIVPPEMDPRTHPQWGVWMEHRRSLRTVALPMSFADDPRRLASFDRPVLLVTGTGTAPFHRRIHDVLAAQLPRAVDIEMPAGHGPHIVSMDWFMAELEDFLDAQYAVSADGTSIGFVGRGTGPAVLFVHGTSADRNSWTRVAPHLTKDVSLYAMDRRGRGLSGDATEWDLAREAEDVAAVVEEIGGPVTIVGHSFGGLCALEAALLTDQVDRLILYEPALPTGIPAFTQEAVDRVRHLVARGELETAMEYMLREMAQIDEDALDAYKQTPLWNARIPIARTIPRELQIDLSYAFDPTRFATMKNQTTLLLGSDSPPLYRDAVETLRSTLPRSEIVILPGQQHVAHHAAPELLARAILHSVKE